MVVRCGGDGRGVGGREREVLLLLLLSVLGLLLRMGDAGSLLRELAKKGGAEVGREIAVGTGVAVHLVGADTG
jgi:hypothetical protein